MLIYHIRNLDEETLANKIYVEQKEKGWTGLAEETSDICRQLNIEDVNTTVKNKRDYKNILTEACHKRNEEALRKQASKVKCERFKREKYGKKEYFNHQNIENTRTWFKTRFGLQPFAGNYSNNRRFASTDWLCRCKAFREEESHLISGKCEVYGDLISNFGDLKEDQHLVNFFRAVLDRRETLEDNDRRWQS